MSLGLRTSKVRRLSNGARTTIDGLPVLTSSGVTWYVDGTNGHTTGSGESWADAVSTITLALGKVTSGNGDIIFIAPGTYAENVSVTKNKVSLIAAVQSGNSKRVIVSAASGRALTLSQVTSFHAQGISFYAAASDAMLTDGEGSLFEDCDFRSDGWSGIVFLAATNTGFTGSGTTLYKCLIRECSSATGAILSKLGTGVALGLQATNVNIWDCQFYTNTGPDIADDAGAGNPTYFYQWDIHSNRFMTKNKTTYLDMDTGNAGGTDCFINGNYFADAAFELTNAVKLPANAIIAGNYAQGGTGAIVNAV